MLEVQGLNTYYGDSHILRGVDVQLPAALSVGLLGRNGMGKTTLIRSLMGYVRPASGQVLFEGRSVTGWVPEKMARLGIGYVPEGRGIFPNLSVRENLELGSYRRGRAARAKNLERVLAVFPRLNERMAQLAGTLSGGEQQMLAIGRGLMGEPRLLILDEPSLGLSPLLVEEMFALIGRLNRDGLAILLVEQNVVQSLDVSHRAYILEHGSIVLSGAAADIRTNPALKRAYLGM